MPVAVYIRYSSTRQDGNLTVETQERRCREFLAGRPELRGEPVALFADKALSGTTFEGRVQFAEMERRAKAGEFRAICCYKYDRLGRDLGEVERRVKRFAFWHIPVLSATEAENKTVRRIMLVLGEGENESRGERTRDGLRTAAGRGWWTTIAPCGYRIVKVRTGEGLRGERAKLEKDPAREPIVRRLFELYAVERLGLDRTAKALNREGSTAPRGGPWDPGTVRSILRNPLYVGKVIQGRQLVRRNPDTDTEVRELRPAEEWQTIEHPELRIISPELWNAAAALLVARGIARKAGDSAAKAKLRTSRYLLSGAIKCADCGSGYMIAEVSRNARGEYAYLVCSHRHRRGDCNNRQRFPMTEMEDLILEEVHKRALTPGAMERFAAHYEATLKELADTGAELDVAAAREITDIDRRRANLVRALENGDSGLESVRARLGELEATRGQLAAGLEARRRARNAPERQAELDRWKEEAGKLAELHRAVIDRTLEPDAEFRAVLLRIVRNAELHSDGRLLLTLAKNVAPTCGAGEPELTTGATAPATTTIVLKAPLRRKWGARPLPPRRIAV
jgi:site-specific DNA recombinase